MSSPLPPVRAAMKFFKKNNGWYTAKPSQLLNRSLAGLLSVITCSDLEWGLGRLARAIEHFWHRWSREPAGTRVVIITLEHPRHTFVMFFLHERRAWSGWGLGKGTGLKARVLTIIFFFLHARFQTNRRLLVRLVTADTVDQSYLWIFLNSEFDWFSQICLVTADCGESLLVNHSFFFAHSGRANMD